MRQTVMMLIAGVLVMCLNAFADDVSIDSSGNISTGVSGAGKLEVTGGSAEKAIVGQSSGTSGTGVYGIHTTSGDYGTLGFDGIGVYGYSLGNWAGYFQGNVRVTGSLTVDGTMNITETDPTVNALGKAALSCANDQIAKYDGSAWFCDIDRGITNETDPKVGTLTSGRWCTTDGTAVNCTSTAPVTAETDPEVGSNTINYVPKWDGTALVAGTIFDNGNIGIGTGSPEMKLQVTGGGMKIGDNGGWASNSIQFEPQSGFHRVAFSDLRFFDWAAGADNVTFKNGNVGIGTTSPLQKLTVAGVIESTGGGVKFPDGTVQSSAIDTPPIQNPRANTITTVITSQSAGVGQYTSITIGTDGLPVISSFDWWNDDLRVVKCGNASCSSGNTFSTGDGDPYTYNTVGSHSSITIGTDGLPVISYYNGSYGDLKVVKCGNAACSSGNTITTLDSAGNVGLYTSIAIGTDGLPVISYYDGTNGDLKVVKCGNAACSSGNTVTTVNATGDVGLYTSITIGTDGLPVISYYDGTNGDLKVMKCGNAACSSGNTITTLDATGDVGLYTSITIGTDGLPVISYYDSGNGDLKVVKCGNAACSSGNTSNRVNATGDVGLYTSITTGTDGLPVISYYDGTNGDLKVVKCGNASCSSGSITTVDSTGDVGLYTSITIGTDGLPVISYYDLTNGGLKVVKCANQFCLNNWSRR